MVFLASALSSALQIYLWGFGISFAFFLLVMLMRGVGPEGYGTHVIACFVLALIWPQSVYEIAMRIRFA